MTTKTTEELSLVLLDNVSGGITLAALGLPVTAPPSWLFEKVRVRWVQAGSRP